MILSSSASTFSNVHNFFHSGTWYVARNLTIAILLLFWLAMAYWTFKDAGRRIEDRWLVILAGVVGLVPLLGPFIYTLLRPPEYLEDVRERKLEMAEKEQKLLNRGLSCPVCLSEADPAYLVCPVCATRLRHPCEHCQRPLEPAWRVCPYCGLEPSLVLE